MSSSTLHPRIAEAVEELNAAQQRMLDVLHALPDAVRAAPPQGEAWSIAQIIEHIVLVEDSCGRLISTLSAQAADSIETDDSSLRDCLNDFGVYDPEQRLVAPSRVSPVANVPLEESLSAQALGRERLLAALTKASGRALATVSFPHPLLGSMNGYQWIHLIAHHQRRHTAQMQRVAAGLERS